MCKKSTVTAQRVGSLNKTRSKPEGVEKRGTYILVSLLDKTQWMGLVYFFRIRLVVAFWWWLSFTGL